MKKLWNKIKAHFSGWPEEKVEEKIKEKIQEEKPKSKSKKPKGLKPNNKKKRQSK